MTRTRTVPSAARLPRLRRVRGGTGGRGHSRLAARRGAFGWAVVEAVGRAGPGTRRRRAPLAVTAIAERGVRAGRPSPAARCSTTPGRRLPGPDIEAVVPFTSDDGTFNVGIVLNTNALIEGDSVVSVRQH